MPWCLGTSTLVRARSMPRSAIWPPDVHTFWPLNVHSSPSLTPLVVRPARSEPAPGSENSWHHGVGPGQLPAVGVLGQPGGAPTGQPEALPPLGDGEVRIPVVVEPVLELGDHVGRGVRHEPMLPKT